MVSRAREYEIRSDYAETAGMLCNALAIVWLFVFVIIGTVAVATELSLYAALFPLGGSAAFGPVGRYCMRRRDYRTNAAYAERKLTEAETWTSTENSAKP